MFPLFWFLFAVPCLFCFLFVLLCFLFGLFFCFIALRRPRTVYWSFISTIFAAHHQQNGAIKCLNQWNMLHANRACGSTWRKPTGDWRKKNWYLKLIWSLATESGSLVMLFTVCNGTTAMGVGLLCPTQFFTVLASFVELCAAAGNIEIVESKERSFNIENWPGEVTSTGDLEGPNFGSMVWPKHSAVAAGPLQFFQLRKHLKMVDYSSRDSDNEPRITILTIHICNQHFYILHTLTWHLNASLSIKSLNHNHRSFVGCPPHNASNLPLTSQRRAQRSCRSFCDAILSLGKIAPLVYRAACTQACFFDLFDHFAYAFQWSLGLR